MSYYNTTDESGKALQTYKDKSYLQEDKIRAIFKRCKELSPSQAHQVFGVDDAPLTSMRRSITNLTSDGFLIKTEKKVSGIYGRPEYNWKLKTSEDV